MDGDIIRGLTAQELRRRSHFRKAPSSPVTTTINDAVRKPSDALIENDTVKSFDVISVSARRINPSSEMHTTIREAIEPPKVVDRQVRKVQPVPVIKTQPSTVLLRQAVGSLKQADHKVEKSKRGFNKGQLLIISMALIVFIVGLAASISAFQTNLSAESQVAAISSNAENSGADSGDPTNSASANASAPPSEVKPTPKAITSYAVAPDLPRYITIDKVHAYGRVKPMTVLRNGELQAPSSIYDAGWYNASAKPGDPAGNGAVLIDGHVLGATYPAIFSKIKTLVAGDDIKITRGDKQVLTYKVVKVQNYNADTLDMGMLLTSIQPGRPGLNLITCGGKYLAKQQTFDQRTVVFAVQV